MYKPNGEERMTPVEERQRREALAERRAERLRAASVVAEALGTNMYAALLTAADPREELIQASYAAAR